MTCVHSKKCLVFAIICFLLVGTDEFSYSISMLSMFSMSYISIDAGFTDFTSQIWGPLLFPGTPGFPQRVVPQDAAQDTWGRRFEGRGVGVLVEWQNKARREKKRNGSDWMAIQKKYIEGNCVQVEMSLKGFCFTHGFKSIARLNAGQNGPTNCIL